MRRFFKILFFIFAVSVATVAEAHSSPAVNIKATSFSIFHSPFSIKSGGLIRDFTYSSNGWVENKLRYNGKELLGEFDLGWYDYGSRYYNPMLGMFTTVDPQAYRGYGWGTYAYGLDNPLKYTDPDGGASGGFLTGFSNSLVQEKGLSAVLGSGAIGGLMGGVGGGIMGGVWGGIDAAPDGRRFFDGATVQTMMLRVMDPGTGGFRNIPLSKIINLFTITP